MTPAKIVTLAASPSMWADLSFEVGGIIKESKVVLGQAVTAFDFDSLNATLGVATEEIFTAQRDARHGAASEHHPADLYGSGDLDSSIAGGKLMALRAEGVKAALDKACALRANMYYGKYARRDEVIARILKDYSSERLFAKANRLGALRALADKEFTALEQAYAGSEDTSGVITSTNSTLYAATFDKVGNRTGTDNQDMTYTDYVYRFPAAETEAQHARADISLLDEQFADFVAGLSLPYLKSVFSNELKAIDMDVKRLQVAYVSTMLMSPIPGIVTGIYKQAGEAVSAGESVVRVENDSAVFMVGTLIYPDMLAVGASATVQTKLFGSSTTPPMPGTVVAARGGADGDDRWDVVISCSNRDAGGKPIVPLNYGFDFKNTTVTVA